MPNEYRDKNGHYTNKENDGGECQHTGSKYSKDNEFDADNNYLGESDNKNKKNDNFDPDPVLDVVTQHEKDKALELCRNNKFFKNMIPILERGMFDDYQFDGDDYNVIGKLANNTATQKEIESSGLFKYFIKRLNSQDHIIPGGGPVRDKLVADVKSQFMDNITEGKDGPEFKQRSLVIVTGLPGAGKSSGSVGEYLKTAIEFDNDIAKGMPALSEYYDNGMKAGKVHPIAKQAQRDALPQVLQEGYNVVWPMIGDEEEGIIEKAGPFLEQGYNVKLVYRDIDPVEAMRRAFKRTIETGRFVPPQIIANYGTGPKDSYNSLKSKGGKIIYGGKDYTIEVE